MSIRKQIKEYRAQEKPGKLHGKVFVKGKHVFWDEGDFNTQLKSSCFFSGPVSTASMFHYHRQATAVTCTLNNGIISLPPPSVDSIVIAV